MHGYCCSLSLSRLPGLGYGFTTVRRLAKRRQDSSARSLSFCLVSSPVSLAGSRLGLGLQAFKPSNSSPNIVSSFSCTVNLYACTVSVLVFGFLGRSTGTQEPRYHGRFWTPPSSRSLDSEWAMGHGCLSVTLQARPAQTR